MKKDDLIFIQDIADAVDKINNYLYGVVFDDFLTDSLKQDAVLMNFTVIGEAASKLTPEFILEYPDFPVRKAAAMRNKIVHEYGKINLDVVWKTIIEDLPELYKSCAVILSK